MTLERKGLATGTILTEAFATYGRQLTKLQEMETLPLIVLPHPIAAQPEDHVRSVTRDAFEKVIASLLAEN
jgi:predicted dienelactone hydrolase